MSETKTEIKSLQTGQEYGSDIDVTEMGYVERKRKHDKWREEVAN
jgi:hypothetical protein